MQIERTRFPREAGAELVVPARVPRTLHLALERVGWAAPVALVFALAARLPYFLQTNFPLGDGGLFVAMSQDLYANHFALPTLTTYNGGNIPFAYPPLAFYVVAFVHAGTGLDALALARWVPLLANLATVLVVVGIGRAVLKRGSIAIFLAPIIFALLPRSYEWMIVGGGLTRSFGYLFAALCVLLAIHTARAPTLWRIVGCAIFAALAIAAHLEEGLFALYSMTLALVCYGHNVRSLLACAAIGLGAAVFSAPWWLSVALQHGLGPFHAASLSSEWSTPDAVLTAVGQFLAAPSLPFSVIGALGVVGAVWCLLTGNVFLVVWLPVIFLLTPRSADSEAVLPLALLVSVAIAEVIVPAFRRTVVPQLAWLRRWRRNSQQLQLTGSVLGLGVLLVGVFSTWPQLSIDPHSLDSLPPDERQAMAWIANNTSPDDRFLVLSRTGSWEEDTTAEWFPVLAGRESLLTPQGAEWLPQQIYARKICLFDKVRAFASWDHSIADLDRWASERDVSYSYIFISKADRGPYDWAPMVASAETSPDYTVLMDTPTLALLRRDQPIQPRWSDSGEFSVALDCQSLADQSTDVIGNFEGGYGGTAAQAWVAEHERALPTRPTLTTLIGQVAALVMHRP